MLERAHSCNLGQSVTKLNEVVFKHQHATFQQFRDPAPLCSCKSPVWPVAAALDQLTRCAAAGRWVHVGFIARHLLHSPMAITPFVLPCYASHASCSSPALPLRGADRPLEIPTDSVVPAMEPVSRKALMIYIQVLGVQEPKLYLGRTFSAQ